MKLLPHLLPRVDFARKDTLVIKEYFNRILGVPEHNIISLIDSDATKALLLHWYIFIFPGKGDELKQ